MTETLYSIDYVASSRALPILFQPPMINANRQGYKTETRRELPNSEAVTEVIRGETSWSFIYDGTTSGPVARPPKFRVGDRLYARESFSGPHRFKPKVNPPKTWPEDTPIWYWADGSPTEGDWTQPKPPMHMPRWASRLTLIVTDVVVERLQDITEEAALREGVVKREATGDFWVPGVEHPNKDFPYLSRPTAREMYAALWDVINGSGAWAKNPWVVAYRYDVIPANIDKILRAAQ